jgi:outer membrane protein assembly factor BamB
MMRSLFLVFVSILTAAIVAAAQGPAPEWRQLHGPSRNGTSSTPLRPGASLAVAWKKPLPVGGAGMVLAGDRVYTLGSDGERDFLFALNTGTGEEAWRVGLGATHADAITNGPNSTPAIAGELVLTVSSGCRLQAVNMRTHQVAWAQDLGATYASRFAKRGGCGMAPLVAGSRAFVLTGAASGPRLAAFDVGSGKQLWAAADLPDSISPAPGWADAGGGLVLYHHFKAPGVSGITAITAETGAVAWQIDGTEGQSDATPVLVGAGRVLLETWPQVSLYDIASRKALWTTRNISAQRAPSVSYQGHLYTFGGQSAEFLTCVEAETGKVKWTSRIYRGHLALAGDTLVVLSEASGLLRLVAADPSGYRELAKVQVLAPGARTGTPPSLAGGRIFVRNLEELVAVAVQ